jgi:predicted amidohydrolase YtcJ
LQKAEKAGLQCALHAIGDHTAKVALDSLAAAGSTGSLEDLKGRRHRIEHLELTRPEDAARLGSMGVVASIQPVHADPAILRAWPSLLGPGRLSRAFAYADFAAGGAVLALGSDAPTAPHAPLANVYIATTRKSAREPATTDLLPVNEGQALELSQAVTAGTYGSAYSVFLDTRVGKLETGLQADFVVVDMVFDKKELLRAKVTETWYRGKRVHGSGEL